MMALTMRSFSIVSSGSWMPKASEIALLRFEGIGFFRDSSRKIKDSTLLSFFLSKADSLCFLMAATQS